jgi:hypothetical protein
MLNRFWIILALVFLFSCELKASSLEEEGSKQLKDIFELTGESWVRKVEQNFQQGVEFSYLDAELAFKDEHIPVYKLTYSKNNLCRTFYTKLTDVFFTGKTVQVQDLPPIYFRLLRDNTYLPFALVDEQQDMKINVGWSNKTPKELVITRGKSNSDSTCLGLEDAVEFVRKISKDVLNFSWKDINATRADDELFEVYLFPAFRNSKLDFMPCKQKEEKMFIREFPYYIYSYDIIGDGIWPDRIEVFKDKNIKLTNFSEFHLDGNKKRTITVAEGITCAGTHYEAYGFADNHSFIKRLVFADGEASNPSYGYLDGDPRNQGKLKVYKLKWPDKKEWFYLSPSHVPGEVTLEPIKEPIQNKKSVAH